MADGGLVSPLVAAGWWGEGLGVAGEGRAWGGRRGEVLGLAGGPELQDPVRSPTKHAVTDK